MDIIYETKGRAREYCELAANLYAGCGHGCTYCYGARVTHTDENVFFERPHPRKDIIVKLEMDARKLEEAGETRPILLCFVCDPYQPLEARYNITQKATHILKHHKLRVTILTKAGSLAQRDLDLLVPGEDAFAVTLTCAEESNSKRWEPNAGTPQERIENLKRAKERGLETWVSLEPVIYPQDSLYLISLTHEFVDHYKVGTMNYHEHGKTINWKAFANHAIKTLRLAHKPFYIKKDLGKYIDYPEGLSEVGG